MILFLGVLTSNSQELESLRNERLKRLEEIELAEELLNKTKTDRENQMKQLNLISKKINNQQSIIQGINRELAILRRQISNYENEILRLDQEIEYMKEEYARMIYKTYLSMKSYNRAQYVLAAADFNQAFKRIKYIQQYSKYRKEQAKKIKEKTEEVGQKRNRLQEDKSRKDELVIRYRRGMISLNNDRGEKESLVKNLQSQEQQIRKELEEKRRAYKRIEEEIERILAMARGEERGTTGLRMTPEEKILSNEFTQNQGRLPWPVRKGVITTTVGKHKHEVLKRVEIENKGIGIATEAGAGVYSVFEGKVSMVANMPGMNYTVLIQHGEFFSVYQNLVEVSVKKGDRVEIKQLIGRAFRKGNAETSEIQFGIWKGTSVMDPELWLAK